MTKQAEPVVQAQMLIRRPVAEVFEAFVDPGITTKYRETSDLAFT